MFKLIQELFKDGGAGINIINVDDVLQDPGVVPLCFWDVATQALTQGLVCVGYKPKDVEWMGMAEWMKPGAENGITWLNPADKTTPRTWAPDDLLVVISSF